MKELTFPLSPEMLLKYYINKYLLNQSYSQGQIPVMKHEPNLYDLVKRK